MSGTGLLEVLERTRVIAIVRGDFDVEQYSAIAQALARAGVSAVELTIEKPHALAAIRELSAEPPNGLLVGAGTVRDVGAAKRAIEAGARYLISPGLVDDVAQEARAAGIPYVPGVFTPTEVEAAVAAGCRTVKLFPARPAGPEHLKALRAPLHDVEFVPTGGITPDDAGDFLRAGALAVGLGSSLFGRGTDPGEIEQRARRLLERLSAWELHG